MLGMRILVWAWVVLVGVSAGAQQTTMLLWPNGNPEPTRVTGPEMDPTTAENHLVAGEPSLRLTNVSKPSMAVYLPPSAKNTRAAALVFPGGGYVRLSMQLEGTEVCDWLNSIGMACVLVKYRVPEEQHYPENTEDLEDAQQAMRLTRTHAMEWKIDPNEIGVIGFSAGAHLAVVLSTHPDFQGKTVPPSSVDARPDFQMVMYPGYTATDGKVPASIAPTAEVPPPFLVQAENDYTAHVESSIFYFLALKDAKVPAEMHIYTQGGHGFGLRPTDAPIATRWPVLADEWLHTIHVLGPPGPVGRP
jgi:acetyl esterase/lipase